MLPFLSLTGIFKNLLDSLPPALASWSESKAHKCKSKVNDTCHIIVKIKKIKKIRSAITISWKVICMYKINSVYHLNKLTKSLNKVKLISTLHPCIKRRSRFWSLFYIIISFFIQFLNFNQNDSHIMRNVWHTIDVVKVTSDL